MATDNTEATPTTKPHLLKLDRRLLAHMGAVKEVCILLATVSFVIEQRYIGVAILLVRGILSYYERISMVDNPITEPKA